MHLDHFLEQFDLRSLHLFVSLLGGLLSAYNMQMWNTGMVVSGENLGVIYWVRRLALCGLSAALLWSGLYAADHPLWQPWPPDLAAIMCLDIFMSAAIVAAYLRNQNGTKVQSTH